MITAGLVFRTTDTPSKECLDTVDTGLDRHNYAAAPLYEVKPLASFVTQPSGEVVGGAVGRTWD